MKYNQKVILKNGKEAWLKNGDYLASQQTIDREFGAFKPISDAAPKYVLSLDRFDYSREGIIHLNIVDFLLGKNDIMLS